MHTDTHPLNGFHPGCEPVLFTAAQRKARAKDAVNVDEFLRKVVVVWVDGSCTGDLVQWHFLCVFCRRG